MRKFLGLAFFFAVVVILSAGCKEKESPAGPSGEEEEYLPLMEADSSTASGRADTLSLSDGFNTVLYGASGMIVLQKLDISTVDPIENKRMYHIISEGADSIVTFGSIPGEAIPESLRVVWVGPNSVGVKISPTLTESGFSAGVPGNTADCFLVWDWESTKFKIDKILQIPYYSQYATDYCWATVSAMLFHYYGATPEYAHKPWRVAGALGLGGTGLRPYSFYIGYAYRAEVKGETGVNPERSMWVSMSNMGEYIQKKVEAGYPVAMFLTSEGHMVLAVGWQGNNIILHDPALNMYYSRAWSDIVSQASLTAVYYTMVVPSTGSSSPTIETGNPSINNGFHFAKVDSATGNENIHTLAKFKWDGTANSNGYKFEGATGAAAPPITSEHNLYPWVRVFNDSRTNAKQLSVSLHISGPGDYFSTPPKDITVPAKGYIDVIVDTVKVSEFADTVGEYTATLNLADASLTNIYDALIIKFNVDSVSVTTSKTCEISYRVYGYYKWAYPDTTVFSEGNHSHPFTSYPGSSHFLDNTFTASWDRFHQNVHTIGNMTVTFNDSCDKVISFYTTETCTETGEEYKVFIGGTNIPLVSSNTHSLYKVEGVETCSHISSIGLSVSYSDGTEKTLINHECHTDSYIEIDLHEHE